MKSKWIKRLLSGMLVLVLALSCVSPASAVVSPSTGSEARTHLAGTDKYPTVYAVMIAFEWENMIVPIHSTQVEHKAGATTTISLERGWSTEFSASGALEVSTGGELEVGIEQLATVAFNGSLAAQVGIGASVSFTTSTAITYEFDDDVDPGFYRMEVVYPTKALTLRIVGYDDDGNSEILGQTSIAHAPRLTGAYITWNSFDPHTD